MPEPIYPAPISEDAHRHIRTFHARHGRVSQTRLNAIASVLPTREVTSFAQPVVLNRELGGTRSAIDFGCGLGALSRHLLSDPDCAVLSIDVHTPGIADIASFVAQNPQSRSAFHLGDGIDILEHYLAEESIDDVYVYFPDPWPKPRQHKRRVIQPYFLDMVHRILKPSGALLIATDIDSYADHVRNVAKSRSDFEFTENDFEALKTSYHERALRLGHTIHTFTMRKINHS